MNILHVTATTFIQPMKSGRNRPLLFGCEDASGKQIEAVVKLRGSELSAQMQMVELLTAQLADTLGIDVPQPAVVELPAGFEAVVANEEPAAAIRSSPGLNFGSVHLGSGFTTWPPGRAPHGHQRDQAAAIFAFDTLIQNPDRRAQNPNLWARSDRLGVYDHEQAFSFLALPIIGGAAKPWNPADQSGTSFRFLENHIFYPSLRGTVFDLAPFVDRLEALGDDDLDGYVAAVPAEWREGNSLAEEITAYLREARQERTRLSGFIKHLLR